MECAPSTGVTYHSRVIHTGADLSELERREVEYRERAWRNQSPTTVVRTEAKVGRNDPCPCGSGKKYKKCCGAN